MDVTESQMVISCHQTKLPVLVLGFIQLLAKESHGNPQTTQAVAKAIAYCLQPNHKAPLLKTTPTGLIEHGEVELVPT